MRGHRDWVGCGGICFLGVVRRVLRWVPNPIIITAITLAVFAMGRLILHKAEHESQTFCDKG